VADWVTLGGAVWLGADVLVVFGLFARCAWEERRDRIEADEVYGRVYDFVSERVQRRGR
jgi:hypothetical protein